MKYVGISACNFKNNNSAPGMKVNKAQGMAVIDYADINYVLNKKGKDKLECFEKNPPLKNCKAGRRLAQRENKKVLDLNKASLPFAVASSVALGIGAIFSLWEYHKT